MKTKYILLIGLFAATMVACSRDEKSLFEDSAAVRAQKAIDNACDVLTSQEAGWEMAYFPNLENTSKGYNMVLKFKKDGSVSVTAKNSATTMNKLMTDSVSTWQVKSDYGPILTFDTYNKVFHAWADPGSDGAGKLGDYEFLILKATPEVVLLKGKKHSAYSVLRPMKNPDVVAYFTACENMSKKLFGNNNIVTLHQGNEKMYLYKGAEGQFMSAVYGSALDEAAATLHPVCSTEDGIIVSTGFGEDVHDHIFYYDSIKGELKSEQGAVMNAGNLNVLFRSYFTDNVYGWSVDHTSFEAANQLIDAVNKLQNNTNTKIKVMGYGYKQSLNMYEGGYFIYVNCSYKQNKSNKEAKLYWTVDIKADENGISITNVVPYDTNTETWIKNIPVLEQLANDLTGEFIATPNPDDLFNAAAGMYLVGEKTVFVKGVTNIKM